MCHPTVIDSYIEQVKPLICGVCDGKLRCAAFISEGNQDGILVHCSSGEILVSYYPAISKADAMKEKHCEKEIKRIISEFSDVMIQDERYKERMPLGEYLRRILPF